MVRAAWIRFVGAARMKRNAGALGALCAAALVAALLRPAPAGADWLSGPIRVMRPDGTVFRVESPTVAGWWRDYRRARCLSCTGSTSEALARAARLRYRVEDALGTRLAAGPRYLVLPEVLDLSWPYAWEFYPSTKRTAAYVVRRGGIADSNAPRDARKWDVWYRATTRMEEVVLRAGTDERRGGKPLSRGRAAEAASSRWPWFGVGAAALFLVAVASISLRRRRGTE